MTVTYKNVLLKNSQILTGTAYEASAYIIDGYGKSLSKKYAAARTNRDFQLEINADTGSTDLTGDTYEGAIRGRLVIGTTQTNASLMGVVGCVDVGASKNIQGNVFGLDGVLDFYGASTAGTGAAFYAGAGRFTLWNEGTTTVGAGGVLCGIDICQNSGSPTLGTGAINPAIHVRCQSTYKWGNAIYIKAASCSNAILAGSVTQTAAGQADGSGIPCVTSRANACEINGDTGSTNLNGDYYVSAIKGNFVLGTTSSNASIIGVLGMLNTNTANFGSGDHYAVRGHLDFWGSSTLAGANDNTGAVSAYVENEATTTVSAGNYLVGLQAYLVGAPTISSGGFNPALWIRSNAGWLSGIHVSTTGISTSGDFIYFDAAIANVVGTTTAAPLNDISATANQGFLRVSVGSTVRYIALYAAKS